MIQTLAPLLDNMIIFINCHMMLTFVAGKIKPGLISNSMKYIIALVISLLLSSTGVSSTWNDSIEKDKSPSGNLIVYCSPDLRDLITLLADRYRSQFPEVAITITDLPDLASGEKITDGTIGFISSEYSEYYNPSMWNTIVGRDVLVPVYSKANPLSKEIGTSGISVEALARAISDTGEKNWNKLLINCGSIPLKIYMIDDQSVKSGLAAMAGENKVSDEITLVKNSARMIELLNSDIYSIGFCKMSDIIDPENREINGEISFLPIDRNGNGQLDYMEQIYDNPDHLIRGIWMGKYPRELLNNVYSVASAKPGESREIEFLTWVLTEGQKYLAQYGYTELMITERQAIAKMIAAEAPGIKPEKTGYSVSGVLLFIALILASVAALLSTVKYAGRKIQSASGRKLFTKRIFDENAVDILPGLYYDKTHTWAFMEKDGMVRIGIDDFLQRVTGPLTRVRMKSTGDRVIKGKPVFSIIQNGKQLDVYSPVTGTVKEYNKILETDTSVLNSSPYTDGWIYRVEPSRWQTEIDFLIIGKMYGEWIKGEFTRLKEFLANYLKHESSEYARVMQDGGELKDGILMDLGPEVWEDFQTNFIDQSR